MHRNWLAITHNLPLAQWYYDDTSQWTLDYPPLFAYFEYLLSWPASWLDPSSIVLSPVPIMNWTILLYQRTTVLLSESILWIAWAIAYHHGLSTPTNLALTLFIPAFLIVDCTPHPDIHFQYNGMLLGLFCISLVCMEKGWYVCGCGLFTVLLGFKHIFLYAVPGYFAFLLTNSLLKAGKIDLKSAGKLIFTGIIVLFLVLFPFFGKTSKKAT